MGAGTNLFIPPRIYMLKIRRTALLLSVALMAVPSLRAQDHAEADSLAVRTDSVVSIVAAINASGNITVEQPEALTRLLTRRIQPVRNADGAEEAAVPTTVVATRNGYRVQIFDDNNPGTARAQAESRAVQFESVFPQWKTYVTFNSPYWQVRVGDFRRRGEAEAALAQIREAMPSVAAYARIVAEKINITE